MVRFFQLFFSGFLGLIDFLIFLLTPKHESGITMKKSLKNHEIKL